MGLSRNKVAVSEGAAGSPPFYGESTLTNTMLVVKRESEIFWVRCSILKDLLKNWRKQQKPKYCEAIIHREAISSRSDFTCGADITAEGNIWGCSSAGRAPALQAGGHGFESHHLHQPVAELEPRRKKRQRSFENECLNIGS